MTIIRCQTCSLEHEEPATSSGWIRCIDALLSEKKKTDLQNDQMRKVVGAAVAWQLSAYGGYDLDRLREVVEEYIASTKTEKRVVPVRIKEPCCCKANAMALPCDC